MMAASPSLGWRSPPLKELLCLPAVLNFQWAPAFGRYPKVLWTPTFGRCPLVETVQSSLLAVALT